MSVSIVEDYLEFAVRALRDDIIHEIEKLPATVPRIMAYLHLSGRHFQGALAFVAMTEAG